MSASEVLLTNFLPPYRIPLLQELVRNRPHLKILLSTPMESDRDWPADWQGLPVSVQRTISWSKKWLHPKRFQEHSTIHFPYDTLIRLALMRPDVIVSAEMGSRTLQSAIYCAFRRRTRLVIWATVSEITEIDRGIIRQIVRSILLRAANAVIVNGSSGARYVAKMGAATEKVFQVPQTTDISPFLAQPFNATRTSPRRLLYAGQLIERKGLIPFVRALSRWALHHPEEHLELTFIGQGPGQAELASETTPSNLTLCLKGSIGYQDLPGVYGRAEIFVFPTLADEWGVAVVEAMAAGLPVLGSFYSQAVEDLVADGENGWTFYPDQEANTYRAIDRALSATRDELSAMSLRARETVRPMTPSRMASDIASVVDYALSK